MKKFKALICDDSLTLRRTIERQLKSFDMEFVHAENGEEAITYLDLHEGEFDLVTLDDQMPQMDGLKTLKALKSMNIQVPPILMVASKGNKEHVVACIKGGANDFILKSHLDEKFIEKVALALHKHHT